MCNSRTHQNLRIFLMKIDIKSVTFQVVHKLSDSAGEEGKVTMLAKVCKYLIISALMSCQTNYDATVDANLSQWVTKPSDQLVSQWGAPSASYKLRDGTKIITYSNYSVTSRNYNYYYQPVPYNSVTYTRNCKISFFIDKKSGNIIKYTYKGDTYTCLQIINPEISVTN